MKKKHAAICCAFGAVASIVVVHDDAIIVNFLVRIPAKYSPRFVRSKLYR